MKQLSKKEMKTILGGQAANSDGQGCSVTCNSGYYSCCYRNILVAYCNCIKDGKKSPQDCDAGGEGSSSCEVEHL